MTDLQVTMADVGELMRLNPQVAALLENIALKRVNAELEKQLAELNGVKEPALDAAD